MDNLVIKKAPVKVLCGGLEEHFKAAAHVAGIFQRTALTIAFFRDVYQALLKPEVVIGMIDISRGWAGCRKCSEFFFAEYINFFCRDLFFVSFHGDNY